jgi:hypothetical protein
MKGLMAVGQKVESGKNLGGHSQSWLQHALDRAAGGGV